jgi:hypothetical protein
VRPGSSPATDHLVGGWWLSAFGDEDPVGWLDEPMHPNAEGHRGMAELLLDRLGLGAASGA